MAVMNIALFIRTVSLLSNRLHFLTVFEIAICSLTSHKAFWSFLYKQHKNRNIQCEIVYD